MSDSINTGIIASTLSIAGIIVLFSAVYLCKRKYAQLLLEKRRNKYMIKKTRTITNKAASQSSVKINMNEDDSSKDKESSFINVNINRYKLNLRLGKENRLGGLNICKFTHTNDNTNNNTNNNVDLTDFTTTIIKVNKEDKCEDKSVGQTTNGGILKNSLSENNSNSNYNYEKFSTIKLKEEGGENENNEVSEIDEVSISSL